MVRGEQRQDNGARSSCRAAVGDGKASGAHTTSQRAAVQHQRNRETQSVSPAGTAPELRCVAIDGVVAAGPEAQRHAHSDYIVIVTITSIVIFNIKIITNHTIIIS